MAPSQVQPARFHLVVDNFSSNNTSFNPELGGSANLPGLQRDPPCAVTPELCPHFYNICAGSER